MIKTLSEWLPTPISPGLFQQFRRFFAFKIFLTSFIWYPVQLTFGRILLLVFLLLSVINAGAKKNYFWGTLFLLFFSCFHLYETFPYSINHYFWEPLFLVLILLYPSKEPVEDEKPQVDGTCCHILQVGVLMVWFFSGIQKVFHGYFLNGEMFGLMTLFDHSTPMADSLRRGILSFQRWSGLTLFSQKLPMLFPLTFERTALHIPFLAKFYFLFLSWMTLGAEILLPIATIFARLRRFSLPLLVVFEILIATLSQEFDIGLTVMLVLLLFFPKQARWSYPLLGVVAVFLTIFQLRS